MILIRMISNERATIDKVKVDSIANLTLLTYVKGVAFFLELPLEIY